MDDRWPDPVTDGIDIFVPRSLRLHYFLGKRLPKNARLTPTDPNQVSPTAAPKEFHSLVQ